MRLIDADELNMADQVLSYDDEWCLKVSDIENAPTVDAEPVIHARWDIRENPGCFDTYGNPDKHAHCTHCGFTWTDLYSVKNYFKCCPGCGAQMDHE